MKTSAILLLALTLPSLVFAQTKDAETEKDLTKIEQDMSDALIRRDAGILDRLIADDFFFTAPDGSTQDKAAFMADLKTGDLKIESQKFSDMKVHPAGADTAFVTYTSNDKGTYKGREISGKYRWTDIFVKRNQNWILVAGQGTGVEEESAALK